MFELEEEPIKTITLNEGQEEALNSMLAWADNGNSEDTSFSLMGSAGTEQYHTQ